MRRRPSSFPDPKSVVSSPGNELCLGPLMPVTGKVPEINNPELTPMSCDNCDIEMSTRPNITPNNVEKRNHDWESDLARSMRALFIGFLPKESNEIIIETKGNGTKTKVRVADTVCIAPGSNALVPIFSRPRWSRQPTGGRAKTRSRIETLNGSTYDPF